MKNYKSKYRQVLIYMRDDQQFERLQIIAARLGFLQSRGVGKAQRIGSISQFIQAICSLDNEQVAMIGQMLEENKSLIR